MVNSDHVRPLQKSMTEIETDVLDAVPLSAGRPVSQSSWGNALTSNIKIEYSWTL